MKNKHLACAWRGGVEYLGLEVAGKVGVDWGNDQLLDLRPKLPGPLLEETTRAQNERTDSDYMLSLILYLYSFYNFRVIICSFILDPSFYVQSWQKTMRVKLGAYIKCTK